MEPHNTHIDIAAIAYESQSFWDDCEKLFSRGEEFFVICEEKSVEKNRNAIKLFLKFELERPRGLARLIFLAKMWVAGISAALLLAVCNRANLLGWVIVSDGLNDNQLLYLKPR